MLLTVSPLITGQGTQWGSLHKRQEPHWVQHYNWRKHMLGAFISFLYKRPATELTEHIKQECRLQLIHLNPHGATTSSLGTPWFLPEPMVGLNKIKVNSLRLTKFFKTHERIRAKPDMPQEVRDRILGNALNTEFLQHRRSANINNLPAASYEGFDLHTSTLEKLGTLPCRVLLTEQPVEGRSSHRVVMVAAKKPADQVQPNTDDIRTLVTFLEDAMVDGARRVKNPVHRIKVWKLDHTFPILMVTIYPGAQARVLYGHFDGAALQVQYTDVLQFTEEGFYEQMQGLLSWSFPICLWETAIIPRMGSIIEEDESDDCSTPVYQFTRSFEPTPTEKTKVLDKVVKAAAVVRAKEAKKIKREKKGNGKGYHRGSKKAEKQQENRRKD
ncbi:hypothetical protein N7520_010631 [Penicillium odoratum]|uniref:uncharacterized protein n=1 Tax=Penicillium odoratum TaxID=1167516 RepID=UPI0025468600|nr:uncharacterized protein N7520_010631 [Penicillium odoratum]KAJ5745449.1 hypothetical protein N7520_010631 [Penicillium odoratum]